MNRKGFSLVEIMVAVATIGILAALLIAAVIASRESSRRLTCSNNIRQMGIATVNYVSGTGYFPHRSNGDRGFSAISMILPQMEHTPLFNAINFNVANRSEENVTAATTVLSSLLCPSDTASQISGHTNYACNTGYDFQAFQSNGVFVGQSENGVSLASIMDGTSNTSMFSEWVASVGDRTRESRLSGVFRTPRKLTQPGEFEEFVEECTSIDAVKIPASSWKKGSSWLTGDHGITAYNHSVGINQNSCLNKTRVPEGAWAASSGHREGVQVQFVDGHVGFVRQSIAQSVWRAIATRSRGEIIGADDL